MIKNFKKGFLGDYGVKMTVRKLHNLCELDWPSFNVGWLPEGTLNLPTVQALHQVVVLLHNTSFFPVIFLFFSLVKSCKS